MLTNLRINGFRGMRKSLTLSSVTTIVGGNGKGKTTILDAIRWCLTGVDGEGLQNHNIFNNRLSNGKKETVTVECIFEEDGIETSFSRTASISGDNTVYAYQCGEVDVPMKKYVQCVEDYLATTPLLKFVLDVRLWDSLTEGELRKTLMLLFNNKDMICEDAYKEVAELSKFAGLDAVKKQLRKSIKDSDKSLDIIAVELDIKEKSLPDAVDSSSLEKMLSDKEKTLAEEEGNNRGVSTETALRMHERAQAIVDAETNYASAESAYKIANISKVSDLERLLAETRSAVRSRQDTKGEIALCEEKINSAKSEMQDLKKRYDEEAATVFDGKCPVCGHAYEEEEKIRMAAIFTTEKKERLSKIVSSARYVRDRIEMIEKDIKEKETRLSAQEDSIKKVGYLEQELDKAKIMSNIKFEDTADGIRLRALIDEARTANAEWEKAEIDIISVLRAEVVELRQKYAEAKRIDSERNKILDEISEIKHRRANVVKDKMNYERLLSLAKNYEVAICQGLEDYINSIIGDNDMRVSLYSVDEDGEAKPQCKVISNGVTDTLNNALRNTIGIKLAESIMPRFAHPCPILVDNCEAFDVENMPQSNCQLVLAKVDNEGGELHINKN